MTADILERESDRACRVAPCGGVQAAGQTRQRLMLRQLARGARDRIRREPLQKAGVRHAFRFQIQQIDAFDAADAAAGAPGECAALFLQRDKSLLHDLQLHFGVRQFASSCSSTSMS